MPLSMAAARSVRRECVGDLWSENAARVCRITEYHQSNCSQFCELDEQIARACALQSCNRTLSRDVAVKSKYGHANVGIRPLEFVAGRNEKFRECPTQL